MKKKLMKVLAVAAGAALACFALSACGGSSSSSSAADSDAAASSSVAAADFDLVKDGTLTVVTSADYPPFEYLDGDDIKGYDADLIREVGNRLGLDVEISNMAFDTLLTQVSGGAADVSISALTVTDDRLQDVDFTDPYYDSNLAVVVLGDSDIESVDDLKGHAIGAQSGSSGEDWVKENVGDDDYTPFQEMTDALASLRSGKVEALVFDAPSAENYVANGYTDCKVLETIPTGEQYAIAVNKDDAALTEAINQALKDMEADGTLDELEKELAQ